MNEETSYPVYEEFKFSRIDKVRRELSKGDVSSVPALRELVAHCVEFHDPVEAFGFFARHCPYKWEHHVRADLAERYAFDWNRIVLVAVNCALRSDVLEDIELCDCYRFLTGEKRRKSIVLKSGEKIVFDEFWKSEADRFAPVAVLPSQYEGRELKIFKKGLDDPLLYILEHSDSALVWIGRQTVPSPAWSIDFFLEGRVEALQRHDCPVCEIENVEIVPISEFEKTGRRVSFDPVESFGLHESHFVLSHRGEDGSDIASGFNDEVEFDRACETVAEYLKSCEP